MNYRIKIIAATMSTLFITQLIAETKITPHVYSRGGMTRSTDLRSREIINSGDDQKIFNLGAWGTESNTMSANLTEITVDLSLNENFIYTYGIDVGNSDRFVGGNDDTSKKYLSERLNYLTFIDGNFSAWVGQNAYRGDGDLLSRGFPFDEHNMLGGGIRLEKVGPLNIEFAYGERKQTDPKLINLFINKIEYPLANGKVKTNLEIHRVNSSNENEKSTAFMAGVQLQKWGTKLLGGNFYHLSMINYSNGYIYGGAMQSAYNALDKNRDESKLVLKWGGDLKWDKKAIFFNVKYQQHMGHESTQKWSFVDYYLRPVKKISTHTSVGIDIAQRFILKKNKDDSRSWTENGTISRVALMASYHMKDKMFDLPSISFFAGKMFKDRPTKFFTDGAEKREEYFLRLNYEVSI